MARTRTLTQLIAEVRDRADIEGAQHITDAQITRYLNQSGAALHALMVDAGEDYFTVTVGGAFPAPVDGLVNINVEADFYKLVSISVMVNRELVPLRRWDWEQFHALVSQPYTTAIVPMYRVVGNEIVVAPGPTGSPDGLTVYVRTFADMSVGTDTFDGRSGWEEWLVWDAAIKCLVKEESDIREAVAERDRVYARVLSQMKSQDLANPHEVVSVGNPWSYEVD